MTYIGGEKPHCPGIENRRESRDIGDMEPTLEQMARLLAESGDYRVTSPLGPQDEYRSTFRDSNRARHGRGPNYHVRYHYRGHGQDRGFRRYRDCSMPLVAN